MKYKAQLSDSEHAISLGIAGESATADIDGRRHEIELRQLSGGEYLLNSVPMFTSVALRASTIQTILLR